jgi:hypothetical protein
VRSRGPRLGSLRRFGLTETKRTGQGGVIAYPSIVPCRTRHTMSVNLFEDWRSWLRDWRFWFFVAMSTLIVAGYLTVFIILLSQWHK